MWLTTERGRATYSTGEDTPAIAVDAAGGQTSTRLTIHHAGASAVIKLSDLTGEHLPAIAEGYARSDDFVARLSQSENDAFGLTLQTRFVQASDRCTTAEWVIEMQTRSLDSHPAVRISVAHAAIEFSRPEGLLLRLDEHYVAILLTPRDRASCQQIPAAEGTVRLQVFGEFLEKGVIQKCRLWLVAWGTQRPSDSEWSGVVERLSESPLPLTT